MKGYIHSIETMGALDGPGLRTVVFFQGCPLKCLYCHNIDCAVKHAGQEIDLDDLVGRIIKNREYWGANGGVTITGGESTFQPEFLLELLKKLKQENVHTVVESCLVTSKEVIDSIFPYVDYWMVSIKHMDEKEHIKLTKLSNKSIHQNILYLDQKLVENKQMKNLRIRFLVIPTITDSAEHIELLGAFLSQLHSLDFLEILPYGSHGKYKWYEIYGKYHLENIPEANLQDMQTVAKRLEPYKLTVKY